MPLASSGELSSFLSSIGASSLSTQLDTTTSQQRGQASIIHDKIQQEIDAVNDATLSLLGDKWDTFTSQLSKSQQILVQLEEEETELSLLETETSSSLPPLISHLTTHQSLVESQSISQHTVTLLSALVALHTQISHFSDSLTRGELYPTALDHLRDTTKAIEKGAEDWIEGTDVWKTLIKWENEQESRFETLLENTFEAAFEFSSTPTATTIATLLSLNSQLKAAPEGPTLSLFEVLKALDELSQLTGKQSKVGGLLARVSKQVLRSFVAPFLEANGTVTWDEQEETQARRTKLRFSYPESSEVEDGRRAIKLEPIDQSKPRKEEEFEDPINELSEFLQFFVSHSSLFSNDPSSARYTSLFTSSFTPSLQSHLITSHLVPSLPSQSSHLTSYLSLLDRATSFESKFLPSQGLFAFLPSSTGTTTAASEESHILQTWSKSLPQHYARHLSEKALTRVREQVKTWDWGNPQGNEMVEVEVREEEEMEGLLKGLELGLTEVEGGSDELDDGGNKKKKEEKRRTELETVPKGAKREMTLEEAIAPRPPRAVTPPPPLPREPSPPPHPVIRLATPPAVATTGGKGKRSKLGASKITTTQPLLSKSPSPPPLFQGDDLPLPSSAPSASNPSSLPPISTSLTSVQLDPSASLSHNRSNSRSSSGGHSTPILSPRPISIPSAASFTRAVEHSDEEQVHEIVERAQRTIAEEGEGIFEPLEEVEGKVEMVVGEAELEREIEVKMEAEHEEEERGREGSSERGMALTSEALEERQRDLEGEEDEERKPIIKEEEQDTAEEAGSLRVEIVEPTMEEIKQEEEERQFVKEEEFETTPQVGDYEPTPQPPVLQEAPQFYSHSQTDYGYAPPQFFSTTQENYSPPQFDPSQEQQETPSQSFEEEEGYRVEEYALQNQQETYEPQDYSPTQQNYEPESETSSFPPPVPQASFEEEEGSAYAPPAEAVPPPPRANPSIPPPPPRTNFAAPPPPRSGTSPIPPPPARSPSYAPPPPRSQAVLSPPPIQPQRPVSPAARTMPVPPPPPPQQARSPVLRQSSSFDRSQAVVSPVPPPPKSNSPYAPPPPRGSAIPRQQPPPPRSVLSPPPSILPVHNQNRGASPSYPRQSTVPPPPVPAAAPAPLTSPFGNSSSPAPTRSVISPRPPSRNQDGPILNHIQQRFASPPPSHVNPYASFAVPAPSQQAPQSSSYIPANDPLLADLFGSTKAPAATYFAPDPPGYARQQRSNSTSSQGSTNYNQNRPSSRGSQNQQYQPQQYAPSSYYQQPSSYQGGEEVEELEDRYAPNSYGGYGQGYNQQEAMRLRGGAVDLFDSESSDEDEDEEGERFVMRLRGGATLDLGEMDEDEGNKSGDDWGFGDGIEEGGDDDAWGFGDDDDPAPPTPSPPVLRNPPPVPSVSKPILSSPVKSAFSPPTSPIRQPIVSRAPASSAFVPSHAPSASISSVTSQTSTLSRPPSYSFSSTLAPPISATSSLPVSAEEEDGEEAEEGEDAWGFDEELETDSPPAAEEPERPASPLKEVEDPIPHRPETPPPPSPPARVETVEAPQAEVIHQVILESSDVLPPISLESTAPAVQARLPVKEDESTLPQPSPAAEEEVDEWGFGAEEEEQDEALEVEPATSTLPSNTDEPETPSEEPVVESAGVVESEPESYHKEPIEKALEEIETNPEASSETPVHASSEIITEEVTRRETPLDESEGAETIASAEGPIIVNDVESQPEEIIESRIEQDPLPTETPALDDAEEGHFDEEESGWGLDVDDEAAEPPVDTLDLPAATPALDVAEEGHSVVESDGWDIDEPIHEDETSIEPDPVPEDSLLEEKASTPTQLNFEEVGEPFPTATPALDDAEFGLAPALEQATVTLHEEPRLPQETVQAEDEILPVDTPALEQAEEGQGIEVEAEEEETSTQVAEPVTPETQVLEPELEGPVDSPPTSTVVASDDVIERLDDAFGTRDASAGLSSAGSTLATEIPTDTPEFEAQPTREFAEQTEPTQFEEESALTAPAELQEQSFPVETLSEDSLPTETAPPVPSFENISPSPPTPTLPEPVSLSDEPEPSHVAHNSVEESINETVVAPLDDAALLGLDGGEGHAEDDAWGIEGEEEEAVDSGMTSQETFIPDERASELEERDLPVEETLIDPQPLESTYADYSRRSSVEDDLSPPHSDTVMVEPMSASNSSGGTHGDRNMSSPEVIEKSDAWGFDLEEGEGAEILEDRDEPKDQEEEEDRSAVQHESERPILHEDSTVQHISERPVVESTSEEGADLLATSVQSQEHTFSPPLEALPEPHAEPSEWSQPPTEETALDNPSAESLVDGPRSISPSPTPAASSPPPPTTEDDFTVDDPWDLDLEEPSEPIEEATRPIAEPAPSPRESVPAESQPVESKVVEPESAEPVQQQQRESAETSAWNSVEEDQPTSSSNDAEHLASNSIVEVEPSSREVASEEEPSSELQPEEAEEEENWGWDDSVQQEQDIEPLQESVTEPEAEVEPTPESNEKEEEENSLVAPLVEAAGAVSAVALGAAAALGLSSTGSEESAPPPPTRPEAPEEPSNLPSPSQPHDTSSATNSITTEDPESSNQEAQGGSADAEGWGWDGEDEEDEERETKESTSKEVVEESTPQPEPPSEPEPALVAPPVRKEKMMVSRRSREIVKIAEEILVEALTVASPSFEHPQFSAASAPLLSTFVSLLSLYRATAAVHNSTLLASVPAIGMQFANDADWIGREVERVWRSKTEGKELSISSSQVTEVETAIESTRQLGRDTRQKQIAIQRAALMESLDEAGGFLRTSDDSRYATCERALQQVTHTLQRLALVWKPVMTPTALYTTLGGLVNEVLLRVLDEIEDQTDISEEESIRLNRLCKMLHELESLFDGSETSVGREVPIWFKFVFLSELLEASMADILFLFDHGHLVDFSPQEIVRLIRALFSDSPLRNRNVQKILEGHPTVTPQEEEDEWAQF